MLRKAGIFAKFQQIRMYPMAIFWPVLLWVGEWGSGDFLLANVTPFLPICLKEHIFFVGPSLDISDLCVQCRFSWHVSRKDMMLLVDPVESMELEQVHVSFPRSTQAGH
jgi:hypothetical protein